MSTIYTTDSVLFSIIEDYYFGDKRYSAWYEFIVKLRPCIDVEMTSKTDFKDNDLIQHLSKDTGIDVKPIKKEEEEIFKVISMELDTISDPFAIYILDVDGDKAKRISEHYGIICHSFQELPEDSPIFQEGIEKNVFRGEKNRGWHELICPDISKLSNSLIFIDRYLFWGDMQRKVTIRDGMNNVRVLLDTILPKTQPNFLKIKEGEGYHILFIMDVTAFKKRDLEELAISEEEMAADSYVLFKKISTKINKIKKTLNRPYNITIEVVSISHNEFNYDETHNRRILSNYFIIRAEHSLKAFRESVSMYTQSLWLDWVASKGIVRQNRSDVPGKSLYRLIEEIREAIKGLKKAKGIVFVSKNGQPYEDIPNKDINILNRLIRNYD